MKKLIKKIAVLIFLKRIIINKIIKKIQKIRINISNNANIYMLKVK